jgi:hypothetical protein
MFEFLQIVLGIFVGAFLLFTAYVALDMFYRKNN